jgi:hypothetical protein
MADSNLSRRTLLGRATMLSAAVTVAVPTMAMPSMTGRRVPAARFDAALRVFTDLMLQIDDCPAENEDLLNRLVFAQVDAMDDLEAIPAPDLGRLLQKFDALLESNAQCEISDSRVRLYADELRRLLAA